MSMVLPKLWSENNNQALQITLSHLKKYKHLIKWKKGESILEFGFADGANSSLTLGPLLPKDYKEFVAFNVMHLVKNPRFEKVSNKFANRLKNMSMKLPRLWSENNNVALQIIKSHLKKYRHLIKWKKGESILEFGFADGRNSSLTLVPLLPKDYKEFIASDISEEMVQFAKDHSNIPRSTISQMDISSSVPTNFQNRFDHIFGFNVMHMVKNPRQAFKNIHSMLKPGGATFLTFIERTPVDDIFYRLSRHPKWKNLGQMISTYFLSENPQEEYRKDIKEASFKDYVYEVEKGSYNFPSEEEFKNLFISVNATLPKIPKEDSGEYMKNYLEEVDRGEIVDITHENGKRKISMNFTCFILVATK